MAVTHDMIAVKLGINRTTVTKALKGDPSIKLATKKKVLDAANLLGYDFKQSQQNRREGKRYFVHELVKFSFVDRKTGEILINGTGMLTNLSTTGLLLKVENAERNFIPIVPTRVKITSADSIDEYSEIPSAKVVRITFSNSAEVAAKFEENAIIKNSILEVIEKKSFQNVDRKAKRSR